MTTTAVSNKRLHPSVLWCYLVVISAGWGSSFLFTKLIGEALPPFAFAAVRGFIAMAALLIWLAVRMPASTAWKAWRSDRASLRHVIVLGTTNGWFANVLTVIAVRYIETSVVAMVQASVPLLVAVMAHFYFEEEQFDRRQLLGIIIGMLGILLIVGPLAAVGQRELTIGLVAMLMTAASYAYGTVYARRIATKDATTLACGQQAFGALVATLISLAIEAPELSGLPASIWVYFAVLGVLCSAVPTVLYLGLLARESSVRSSLVAYLQPLWATLLGFVILGERLRPLTLFGAAVVILGVAMSSRQVPR